MGKWPQLSVLLDDRIARVVVFSGFTPFRSDTDQSKTGGIRRWWEWHALLPKLGLFHGKEAAIPYDYDELMAAIGPRPLLVVSPEHDWHASIADVRACIEQVKGAHPALTFEAPDDINRFQSAQHHRVIQWLEATSN